MNRPRSFYDGMKASMTVYKNENKITFGYEHILPARLWSQNLWLGIRQAAIDYFEHEKIKWHNDRDNLLSSQVMCVNIFYPMRNHPFLLESFLKEFYPSLAKVSNIEFEYIGHKNYLNERGGRGFNRTSADVAIEWKDSKANKNLLLVEFKFTERNFGDCAKSANPNPERCSNGQLIISSPQTQCYRSERDRPYWKIVLSPEGPFILEMLGKTQYCPFRYDFYQLMRNQLLAKCIAEDKDLDFSVVEFAVCYDDRNKSLLSSRHPINGVSNPLTNWKTFLKNPNSFRYFTTQSLLEHVELENLPNELKSWRAYLTKRYGL